LRLLADENAIVNRGAADELARHAERVPSIVPALIERLSDDRGSVRFAAARALWKIGPAAEPAIPVLKELLDHPDPRVRSLAADTLGRIGVDSPEAREALASHLDTEDFSTRLHVLHGLSHTGTTAEHEVPKLLALLRDPDLQTHQAAGRALASALAGDPGPVLPELVAMLGESDPLARTGAAYALSCFGAAAEPALDPLITQLDDPHPLPRTYAVVALGAIGPAAAAALPRLGELQWDRNGRISSAAREALKEIRRRPRPAKRR
jgi:HEAT repeat protein